MSAEADARNTVRIWRFVAAVAAVGVFVLGHALVTFPRSESLVSILVLGLLTIASGRLTIKVPGHDATVSISEIFVFTSILLFGPSVAAVIVALDGACASLLHKDRRLYRAIFNIAEPAISAWSAGHVFALVAAASAHPVPALVTIVSTVAMTATYFFSNTVLTAMAVGIESGARVFDVWRQGALYLAINYEAAASVAALAIGNSATINLQALGLIGPLLLLSYAAYSASSRRVEEAHAHVSEIQQLYTAAVETLALAVDAKDQVTHGHIRRVQRHTVALARALGVDNPEQLKALEAASLLHDVGKLAIPDHILNKPGALTSGEYDTMKRHTTVGATILETVRFPYPVVPVVRHHHENWDGTGYPDRIAGDAIPLGARILTVVDCFDAVTSDRPYRRKLSDAEGLEILRARSGTMYDPAVVEAFERLLPELRRGDAAADVEHGLQIGRELDAGVLAAPVQAAHPETTWARSHGFETWVERLVTRLEERLPGVDACLYELDAARGRLNVVYAAPRIRSAAAAADLGVGQGLSGWVAANRHGIGNSDPRLDLGEAAAALGLRQCMSTPIFAGGTLVGVLTVFSTRAQRFTDDENRVLGMAAEELATNLARAVWADLAAETAGSGAAA